MSDHNQKTLKQAINQLFDNLHIQQKVKETRLINSWEKVMGSMIAKHTRNIFINKGFLFIYLDNPALKNELSYAKEKIAKLLNEEAGEEIIKEVIIK